MTCVLHKYMGFFPGKLLLLKVNIESGRVRVLKALKQSVPQDLAQKLSSSFQLQKCSTCRRNESLLRGLKRFSPSFPAVFPLFFLALQQGPCVKRGGRPEGTPRNPAGAPRPHTRLCEEPNERAISPGVTNAGSL